MPLFFTTALTFGISPEHAGRLSPQHGQHSPGWADLSAGGAAAPQ